MLKRRNLVIGSKIGDWEILYRIESSKRSRWACRCVCGSIRQVETSNLLNGLSTKCRACCKLKLGEAGFRDIYRRYRMSAEVRSFEFALSEATARALLTGSCGYCGQSPKKEHRVKGCHGSFTYNGIDRKDSSAGYTEANSVSCCTDCNYMKRSMSVDVFYAHIKKIVEYLGG
jgi:hypothetical protein